MLRAALATCLVSLGLSACAPASATVLCEQIEWRGTPVTVCEIASGADIRLHLGDTTGKPLRDFRRLKASVNDGRVVLAMNGGMYHRDRSAVGLHVEDGVELHPLVTSKGPGNFHMLPNGVFWIGGDGAPHVSETVDYAALAPDARFATQSGPMLVIGGQLHPKFLPGGTSKKIRNGVGVSASPNGGDTTWFAVSDAPINFHDFATLFRDRLGTPDALYLDGTISRLFIPKGVGGGERNDGGVGMGPMLSVVERN